MTRQTQIFDFQKATRRHLPEIKSIPVFPASESKKKTGPPRRVGAG